MERSSPLAALQPNVPVHWGQQRSQPKFDTSFLQPGSFKPSLNFNFKDMSIPTTSKSDYFSWNGVRGSSPTASLAADLSQNFHIDQTPQASTPRRSLFTRTNLPALDCRSQPITPPIPDSSPLPTPDADPMELSPLPHKAPFVLKVEPPNTGLPTPDPTPTLEQAEDISPLSPKTQSTQPLPMPPSRPASPPRNRKPYARPSMKKQYSSSAVPSKLMGTEDSHTPAFMFGARSSTTFIPLESFAESPPSERKPLASVSTTCLAGPPVAKFLFPANGSPAGPMTRRPSVAARPPRIGIARRTQSMQYSRPERQEKRACTAEGISSIVEQDDVYAPKLPHFKHEDEHDSLPRITKETLVTILQGNHSLEVSDPLVIDCRFEYEFEGGHIDGAVNYNDKESLAKKLFDGPFSQSRTLIFHCEYSAHRAPIMARFIRQRDRSVNQDRYPMLSYPEVYILDGGYSGFFQSHRNFCFPQEWVRMDAEEHKNACERGMANVKRRTKLCRAQTYAFGQTSSPIQHDSSPLALGNNIPSIGLGLSNVDRMDVDIVQRPAVASDASPNPFAARAFRRLGSY